MGVKLRELNSEWNAGEKVYSDDLNDTFDYKIGESRVYSDGISASQLESNNSIQFGQTDAAGKINKLFQSFVANKNSILAVSVKKDTTVYPSLSNSPTLSEYLYSEYDHPSNNNFRDNGVISSSYRQIAWVYMGDNSIRWAKYTKNISDLVVGEEYIFSVEVRNSNLNGSSVVMVVNGSPNTLATTSTFKKFEFKFIASATSTTVELQINNNIVNPNNFSVDFKNAILIRKIAYNKVLNIYADNDGVPSGVSLGTATVLGSAIELIGIGEDIQFIFSPAIEDILDGQRYWISISQETSNDDAYLNLGYNDTEIPNFTLKKWNTTDGYVPVTGSLYLKVIQNGSNLIPALDEYGQIREIVLKNYSKKTDFELVPSDVIILYSDTERASWTPAMTKVKEALINESAKYRISFRLRSQSSSYTSAATIYKNGTAFGTPRSTNSTTYVLFTEDLIFTKGDLVQLYIQGNASAAVYIREFRIGISNSPKGLVEVVLD